MKDHPKPEATFNNKECEGSATDNLKCLYPHTGQLAKNGCFMKKIFIFFTNLLNQSQL